MGRNRFVVPEIVRIDIGEGDWIDVKKRLTIGEQRRAHAAVVKEVRVGDSMTERRVTPDMEMVGGKAEVLAYLVGWSLTDAQGKGVSIDSETKKLAAIDGLDPDDYEVINAAVVAHANAMEAERAEAKKSMGGETTLSAISPSVA